MNILLARRSGVAAAIALSGSLAAQCDPSDGPLMGAPVFVSMRASTTVLGGDGASGFVKQDGFSQTAPSQPTVGPNFDLKALFTQCGAQGDIEVDATSLGLDLILANSVGEIDVPPNAWGALSFSVSTNTIGAPGTKLSQDSVQGPIGSHIFSYVLPSTILPPETIGITQRGNTGQELGLGGASNEDVDALDVMIPSFTAGPRLQSMMPTIPHLYFSVSKDSLANVPAAWFSGTPKSGATILLTVWSPRTGWSCPGLFKPYFSLGMFVDDDLDALAVDRLQRTVIYSATAASSPPSQFMFVDCSTDFGSAFVLRDNTTGEDIEDAVGLGSQEDDVDAVCALDPSLFRTGGGPVPFNPQFFSYGTYQPTVFLPPTPGLSSSVYRATNSASDTLVTYVNGLPPNGAADGFAFLSLIIGGTTIPVTVAARDPFPTFCGDPISLSFPVPPGLPIIAGNVGFHWIVTDTTVSSIGEAHPVLINL